MDWNPPDHDTAQTIHAGFLGADGSHDIQKQLKLSGEPLIPQLRKGFKLKDPLDVLEYQDLTMKGRAFCETYADYWNGTAGDDGEFARREKKREKKKKKKKKIFLPLKDPFYTSPRFTSTILISFPLRRI